MAISGTSARALGHQREDKCTSPRSSAGAGGTVAEGATAGSLLTQTAGNEGGTNVDTELGHGEKGGKGNLDSNVEKITQDMEEDKGELNPSDVGINKSDMPPRHGDWIQVVKPKRGPNKRREPMLFTAQRGGNGSRGQPLPQRGLGRPEVRPNAQRDTSPRLQRLQPANNRMGAVGNGDRRVVLVRGKWPRRDSGVTGVAMEEEAGWGRGNDSAGDTREMDAAAGVNQFRPLEGLVGSETFSLP